MEREVREGYFSSSESDSLDKKSGRSVEERRNGRGDENIRGRSKVVGGY